MGPAPDGGPYRHNQWAKGQSRSKWSLVRPAANANSLGIRWVEARTFGAQATDETTGRGDAEKTRRVCRDGAHGCVGPHYRTRDPHLSVPAVQHTIGIDGADTVNRGLPVRVEIRLWVQPPFHSPHPCSPDGCWARSRSAAILRCSGRQATNPPTLSNASSDFRRTAFRSSTGWFTSTMSRLNVSRCRISSAKTPVGPPRPPT